MKRVQIVSIILNVFCCLIFTQSVKIHSFSDYNNLLSRRPPGNDVVVLDQDSGNGVRIAASSFIVDCDFVPNVHFIIRINEDWTVDDIPDELLANGPETSEELFDIVTFKSAKVPRTSINATHVFCDKNNENCRYYDFSHNWIMQMNQGMQFREQKNWIKCINCLWFDFIVHPFKLVQ